MNEEVKLIPKGEVKTAIKPVNTAVIIIDLKTRENIWNHLLPDHFAKSKAAPN